MDAIEDTSLEADQEATLVHVPIPDIVPDMGQTMEVIGVNLADSNIVAQVLILNQVAPLGLVVKLIPPSDSP